MKRRRCWAVALPAGLLLAASPALATEGEHEWQVGLGLADVARAGQVGPAAAVDAGWWLHATDFWSVGGSVHDRRGRGAWSDGATSVTVDGRFVIDALQWIPALVASAGPVLTQDGVALQVRLGAEVSYRTSKETAWGLSLAAEQDGVASLGPRYVVSLSRRWYGGNGIGLDL
jgi:hypothetical protein